MTKTASPIDALFDNALIFTRYFTNNNGENNTQSARDGVLRTDRLRYLYCLNVSDRKEVYSQITDSEYLYKYCAGVRDRKEVWKKITEDTWRVRYCEDVKDRAYLWSKLSENQALFDYVAAVTTRAEVLDKITDNSLLFSLCYVWKKAGAQLRITESKWACAYCCLVKNDPKVAKWITEPKDMAAYFVIRGDESNKTAWYTLCRLFPELSKRTFTKFRKERVAMTIGMRWRVVQQGPRHEKRFIYEVPNAVYLPF